MKRSFKKKLTAEQKQAVRKELDCASARVSRKNLFRLSPETFKAHKERCILQALDIAAGVVIISHGMPCKPATDGVVSVRAVRTNANESGQLDETSFSVFKPEALPVFADPTKPLVYDNGLVHDLAQGFFHLLELSGLGSKYAPQAYRAAEPQDWMVKPGRKYSAAPHGDVVPELGKNMRPAPKPKCKKG